MSSEAKQPCDFHTAMLFAGFEFDHAWPVNENLYNVRYKRDNVTAVFSVPSEKAELLLNIPQIAQKLQQYQTVSNKVMSQC